MSALACPRPSCAKLNRPTAITCKACQRPLGLETQRQHDLRKAREKRERRALVKAMLAERQTITFGRCAYCGRATLDGVCSRHRDLVALDPQANDTEGIAA